MSNIQNEEIKENIKEELEEMSMNDFSNLVEKYDLDVSIIDGIFYDVVNKLFEERSL